MWIKMDPKHLLTYTPDDQECTKEDTLFSFEQSNSQHIHHIDVPSASIRFIIRSSTLASILASIHTVTSSLAAGAANQKCPSPPTLLRYL